MTLQEKISRLKELLVELEQTSLPENIKRQFRKEIRAKITKGERKLLLGKCPTCRHRDACVLGDYVNKTQWKCSRLYRADRIESKVKADSAMRLNARRWDSGRIHREPKDDTCEE